MNKVILIQRPKRGLDVSKAARFGDLVDVENGERHGSIFDINEYCEYLLSRLDKIGFNHKTDYVCVVGSMVNVCIALVCIARAYSDFQVLLFNSVVNDYVPRKFEETSLMQKGL